MGLQTHYFPQRGLQIRWWSNLSQPFLTWRGVNEGSWSIWAVAVLGQLSMHQRTNIMIIAFLLLELPSKTIIFIYCPWPGLKQCDIFFCCSLCCCLPVVLLPNSANGRDLIHENALETVQANDYRTANETHNQVQQTKTGERLWNKSVVQCSSQHGNCFTRCLSLKKNHEHFYFSCQSKPPNERDAMAKVLGSGDPGLLCQGHCAALSKSQCFSSAHL